MNDADAQVFIRTRCVEEVEDKIEADLPLVDGLPTQYDNAPDINAQNGQNWARASIRMADNRRVSIGTPSRFRHPGVLIYNIFSQLEDGSDLGTSIADFVRDAFQNRRVNDVTYRTASTPPGGVSEGWWQQNISIPFYFDQLS